MVDRQPATLIRRLSVVVLLVAAGCTTTTLPSRVPGSASASAIASVLPDDVANAVGFDAPVWSVEAAGDVLWVESGTEQGPRSLNRVDVASRRILGTMNGAAPLVIDGTLWYQLDGNLIEADGESGSEIRRFHPPAVGPMWIDHDTVWIGVAGTGAAAGSLQRIDLATNRVMATVPLPSGSPTAVLAFGGSIWVAINGSDVVLRVNPSSNAVLATIDGGSGPASIAAGLGSVWVSDRGAATLVRIDPETNSATTIPGPGRNVGITVISNEVWAATPDGIAKVSPYLGAVSRLIDLGTGGQYPDIAQSHGALWVTTGDRALLYEIPLLTHGQ